MSAICLKCRQAYSEDHHECLDVMTLKQLTGAKSLPDVMPSDDTPTEEDSARELAAVLDRQSVEWDEAILAQYVRFTSRGMTPPVILAAKALNAHARIKLRRAERDRDRPEE